MQLLPQIQCTECCLQQLKQINSGHEYKGQEPCTVLYTETPEVHVYEKEI